jgi:hypothetical protein
MQQKPRSYFFSSTGGAGSAGVAASGAVVVSAGGVVAGGGVLSPAHPSIENVSPAIATTVNSFFIDFLTSLCENGIYNKQDIPAERFHQIQETSWHRIIP